MLMSGIKCGCMTVRYYLRVPNYCSEWLGESTKEVENHFSEIKRSKKSKEVNSGSFLPIF